MIFTIVENQVKVFRTTYI